MIRGADVLLYVRTKNGEDEFHAPVWRETPVTVHNVLIGEPDADAVVSDLQLCGRRLAYVLAIPKDEYLFATRSTLAESASFGLDFGEVYKRSVVGVRVYGVPRGEKRALADYFARINDDYRRRATDTEYHDGEVSYDYMRLNCAKTIASAFHFGAGYADVDVSSAWLLKRSRLVAAAKANIPTETAIKLVHKYPNLLVTQTLSKSRSLAGLRVGLAVGHPDLIEALERIKNSFNSYPLDRIAIVGAAAAFADREYFEQTCQWVIDSREQVVAQLQALGFEVLPSAANFIFARHPEHDAAALAAKLRDQGVIVRHFKQLRIAQFLRISIGTPEQNAALIEGLSDL